MSARSKSKRRGSQNGARLLKVESLERLRDRVEAAADEIVRLRGENSKMAADISKLRSSLDEAGKKPALAFDEDPKELRAKVKGFIRAIDEYLQAEA